MGFDTGKSEILDTLIRGFLEKDLDSLTPESFSEWIQFKDLLPLSSLEDFAFGFLVGFMYQRFSASIQITRKRQPNENETHEFIDLIQRRTLEIKGKIKLAMGK